MDLTARFGVNTDVDANPDDVFYEDEDLSDVDANVVTMDENGAVVSEKTVEDVLDNGIGSGMRRFSDMRGANGNLVVMLDTYGRTLQRGQRGKSGIKDRCIL